MNVDEPIAVGLDDIVSIVVAFFTAAEPISGPIAVELELDPTGEEGALLEPTRPSALKNACVDAGSEIRAGYGLVETKGGAANPPTEEFAAGEVVPCTELSETPAVVGASPGASGSSSEACALAGSIWTLRLVSAAGSTRLVSIGGWTNVAGGSELDWTAAALAGCG